MGTDQEQVMQFSYSDTGKILSAVQPSGVTVSFEYDDMGFLYQITSSDHSIHYSIKKLGKSKIQLTDHVSQTTLVKVFDEKGQLIREIFPNGQEVRLEYKDNRRTRIYFPKHGGVNYSYNENNALIKISRFSESGEILYSHGYSGFNQEGNPEKESLIYGLGETIYSRKNENTYSIISPFSKQELEIYPGIITISTDSKKAIYLFDKLGQLQIDGGFDSLGNPIRAKVNEKNELIEYQGVCFQYDANGNLIKKITADNTITFSYDAFDRINSVLFEDTQILFTYDLEGRRLSKEIIMELFLE